MIVCDSHRLCLRASDVSSSSGDTCFLCEYDGRTGSGRHSRPIFNIISHIQIRLVQPEGLLVLPLDPPRRHQNRPAVPAAVSYGKTRHELCDRKDKKYPFGKIYYYGNGRKIFWTQIAGRRQGRIEVAHGTIFRGLG